MSWKSVCILTGLFFYVVLTWTICVYGKSLGITDSEGNTIEVKPPDHLEAVKMEQDGQINEDFRKEIFLGNHEDIDNLPEDQKLDKLKEVFAKADKDKDGELTLGEIGEWINLKIKEHFDEAKKESKTLLAMLDTDKDGFISWKEYMVGYLRSQGHPADKAEKHMAGQETLSLLGDEKDEMIRLKFRWKEAEQAPRDDKLTEGEFLNFRHPEASEAMMKNMVRDIMSSLDQNSDGELTAEEFSHIPGEVEMPAGIEIDDKEERKYVQERTDEFNKYIDDNKNGKVTEQEMLNYLNPTHFSQGLNEGEKILRECDVNHDFKLDLDEILNKKEYILGSKLVSVERSFHDEF